MGQVIPFAAVASRLYPALATALDLAECVLLRGLRQWVAAFRRAEAPLPRLCGVLDAVFSVDAQMRVVVHAARQTVAIHCPHCTVLSQNEQHLLHVAAPAQAGDSQRAERGLRTALLTAQGAEFALGPIEGLGDVFAMAGLFFRRRPPPDDQDRIESWTPTVSRLRH